MSKEADSMIDEDLRLGKPLGGVSYVDSSGIGELVSRYTTTKNQGGQLKLLKLPKKIKDLLMITKLLTVFEIYEDEESAMSSSK